jgi:hypothetical protein
VLDVFIFHVDTSELLAIWVGDKVTDLDSFVGDIDDRASTCGYRLAVVQFAT